MSVSSTTAKVQYTGNGSASVFAYTFKIFDEDHIKVTKVTISTGAEEVLEITTDYTVDGVGEENGGNVTLVAGALSALYKLVIERVPPLTQGLDLAENDNLPAEEVEKAFDKDTHVAQYLKNLLDRAVLQPVTSTTPLAMPTPSTGKTLKWTAGGALENSTYDPDEVVEEAQTAQAAAEAAQAAAEAAQTAAETAETNAETAETNAETAEQNAENYATKTDGFAAGSDNSSKSWAVGGTGNGQPAAGPAKDWAEKTSGTVDGSGYSAKEHARGTQTRGQAGGGSAKDWANYTGGTVDNAEYSAKKYAQDAAASAAEAAASGLTELKYNVAVLGFQLAVANSLTQFNLVDGIVDEFADESGIDTGGSTNEEYDSSGDLYRPTQVETDIATGGTALSGGDAAGSTPATPQMTSNTAPSGVASASVAGSGAAYLAFDRTVTGTTGWGDNAHSGFPQWLKYDFGSGNGKVITGYGLVAPNTVPERTPGNFKLQGSNNDTDWTDLDTQTSQTFTANQKKTYTFSNATSYRYYRLYVTAVSSGDEVLLQELELYASLAKANAFDDSTGTYWASSQTSGSVSGAGYIGYDFGSNKTVRGFSIKQNAANQGITSVKVQRSSNGSDWTDVETVAILANTTEQTKRISNTTAARYWRLLANAETVSGSWEVQEVEFFDTINNMTLVSDGFTAEAQPDTARVVIREEAIDSITLNTDLTVEVSRDGGTTWEAGTLVDEGDYSTGVRILAADGIDLSGQPAGTTMKYRIKSLNNKDLKIHGVALAWDE